MADCKCCLLFMHFWGYLQGPRESFLLLQPPACLPKVPPQQKACSHFNEFVPHSSLCLLQQGRADTSSSAVPAPAKKVTVWKKLKKALLHPGKSKREATAQHLMQGGSDTPTSQRYSEKHANQTDGVVSYSRKTSFQEAQENLQPAPQPYRSACAVLLLPLQSDCCQKCQFIFICCYNLLIY